jgi:hypothetical protein
MGNLRARQMMIRHLTGRIDPQIDRPSQRTGRSACHALRLAVIPNAHEGPPRNAHGNEQR